MKINLVKHEGVLKPALDDDKAKLSKSFTEGDIVEVTIKKNRNAKFSAKYWCLIGLVFESLPENFCLHLEGDFYIPIPTKEMLHYQIKLKSGLYEKIKTWGGHEAIQVKSVAFDKMDDLEFSAFYDKTFDIIEKYFLVDSKRDEIEPMVAGYF